MLNITSYEPANQDWNDLQRYLSVSVLAIVDVSAVLLNSLVVSIILMDRELREKPDSLLIANLALSDLLVSLTIIPFSIDTLIHKKIRFSDTTAAFLGFANFAFCIASIMTLMVLVIDQTLTIKLPFRYAEYRTQKAAVYAMIGTWVHSISCALPPMFGLSSYSCFIVNTGPCSNYQWAGTNGSVVFTILVTSLSWGLALAVTVACYVQIATIAVKQRSKIAFQQEISQVSAVRLRVQTKEELHTLEDSLIIGQKFSQGSVVNASPQSFLRENRVDLLDIGKLSPKVASSHSHLNTIPDPSSVFTRSTSAVSTTSRNFAKQKYHSSVWKPAITLLVIIVTYFCTWSPFCILLLVEIAIKRKKYTQLSLIFLWIGHGSSVLNPIIYFLRYRKFRRALWKNFKRFSITFNVCKHAYTGSESS